MIFILPFISRELELWSINHTSIYENSESNDFKNIKFLGEISNNWLRRFITNTCIQDSWILLITINKQHCSVLILLQ